MIWIELVIITLKHGSVGNIKISRILDGYVIAAILDKVAWISWEKQGNALKYFCATVEILWSRSPPWLISECKIWEGYIIAATCEQACLGDILGLWPWDQIQDITQMRKYPTSLKKAGLLWIVPSADIEWPRGRGNTASQGICAASHPSCKVNSKVTNTPTVASF